MGTRFINREKELAFLEKEYREKRSSFVVIYGRRRIGKTALIRQFIKDKPGMYFLASEEMESQNIANFKDTLREFTANPLLEKDLNFSWDHLFEVFAQSKNDVKRIMVIDEFQYLGKVNKAFPSIFQRAWDTWLEKENVMVILCGSLINMMESQTLSYSSPLYGRRTGQIKMKQLDYRHFKDFFHGKTETELIEYYAVTGGVPKYIEIFNKEEDIFSAIRANVLNPQHFLYEEPVFLLEKELGEIGSYFSIIKTIAHGNHKLSKIAAILQVPQSNLTRYIQTLIDLDLLERQVPVTEANPARSKQGLYFIKDYFILFWFRFVYPYRGHIEMEDIAYVMERIRRNFIDNHVSYVFEWVCQQKMWELNVEEKLPFRFMKIGRWWNKNTEIDIAALSEETGEIILGECKYTETPVGVKLFYQLLEKANQVEWRKKDRRTYYIIFGKSGFTEEFLQLSRSREDLLLKAL